MTDGIAGKQLCGVEVELDLSLNPTVRDMFKNPEAFRQLLAFFKEHGIAVVSAFTGGGDTTTNIRLEGPAAGVREFVDEFLCDDPEGVVYTLLYLDS
jgi:hypothetical protein